MALEEEFETEISDNEAEGITTVKLACDYINKHSGGKPDDGAESTKEVKPAPVKEEIKPVQDVEPPKPESDKEQSIPTESQSDSQAK